MNKKPDFLFYIGFLMIGLSLTMEIRYLLGDPEVLDYLRYTIPLGIVLMFWKFCTVIFITILVIILTIIHELCVGMVALTSRLIHWLVNIVVAGPCKKE